MIVNTLKNKIQDIRDIITINSADYSVIESVLTTIKNSNIKRNNISPRADELLNSATDIVKGEDWFKGIDINLGNIKQTYIALDNLIKDIRTSINWLLTYIKLTRDTKSTISEIKDLHEQLINLGKAILGRAIQLTPIDTGFLRSSGVVIDLGDAIVIAFVAPYALYVHENLQAHHNVGRAKFLEVAVQEFFPTKRVWTESYNTDGVAITLTVDALQYLEGQI